MRCLHTHAACVCSPLLLSLQWFSLELVVLKIELIELSCIHFSFNVSLANKRFSSIFWDVKLLKTHVILLG